MSDTLSQVGQSMYGGPQTKEGIPTEEKKAEEGEGKEEKKDKGDIEEGEVVE